MCDLPPDIITAILTRLPVKSLLRCRCVSRPWRSMIDGRDFIKLHLHHSAETNSNRTLLVKSIKLFYVNLDSFEQLDTGDIRFKPRYIAGSCNGLVLLVSDSNDIVLWNPSTRKLNRLRRPFEGNCRQERYALGYDSKHDDYKVVGVAQPCEWGDVKCVRSETCWWSETAIYSLRSKSWKSTDVFPYLFDHNRSWVVYLNDALHAGVQYDDCSDPEIKAFDLAEEEHRVVPTPEFGGGLSSVEVLGGCLAAVVFGKMNSSEVWVMREYGVKGSWFKLLSFDPVVSGPCLNLCPLAYSKSGDEVLLNYEGFCLNWYNLRSKAVTIPSVEGLSASFGATAHDPVFDAWVCVESLVSPYGPGGVGIEKKGKKGKEIKKKRDDFLSVGFKLVL